MLSDKIVDELLHYHKLGQDQIIKDLERITKGSDKWCPFSHGRKTDNQCYRLTPAIQFMISYLEKYLIVCEYLDVDHYFVDDLQDKIEKLKEPEHNFNYIAFKDNVLKILEIINMYSNKVFTKINRLSCEECGRLDESLNCFRKFFLYSSVIMAVSAVESRLHYLIKKRNNTLYRKYFEKATLGQLILLFDKNQYKDKKFEKIKKILPLKYKSLIEIFNEYRVYSVHPKNKEIKYKVAQSILNLAFAFLLDDETSIQEKNILKCK
ncbi:MAG: hypothetical protein WC947_08290 [Elusimicrobiota bacterium]